MKVKITGVKREWPFVKDEEVTVETDLPWQNNDGLIVFSVEEA